MQKKSVFRSVSSVGTVSLAFLALTSLSPAQAGFQWVPPESVEAAPAYAPAPVRAPEYPAPQIIEAPVPAKVEPLTVMPAPAPLVSKKTEAPLPLDSMMEVPLPLPAKAADRKAEPLIPEHFLRLPEGMKEPVAPKAEPAVAAAAKVETPQPVAMPAAEEKVVRGFAKNVPLTVALRQILPADYGFAVDQNVSLGTQVSWQGGAPWRTVLTNMLAPVGLTIKEKDQLIEVGPKTSAIGDAIMSSASEPMGKSAGTEKLLPAFDVAMASKADSKPTYLVPPEPEAPKAKAKAEVSAPRTVGESPAAKSGSFLTLPAGMEPTSSSAAAPVSLLGRDTVVDSWTANKGDTLHEVLTGWSKRANIELSWQAEYDFPLQASASFGGTFEEAVRNLLAGFENAMPQPVGTLHNNQVAGQTVLIIQTRGNKYTD